MVKILSEQATVEISVALTTVKNIFVGFRKVHGK